jgi:3-oxoacyl-[acyl-carrier-protein] synthase-3
MDLCVPQLKKPGSDYVPEILVSLDRYGNTSSTSHFVVMDDYMKKGLIKPGSRVLFMIMASGIILGAVSATFGDFKVH